MSNLFGFPVVPSDDLPKLPDQLVQFGDLSAYIVKHPLTAEGIAGMPAGRMLDVLVAVCVFGATDLSHLDVRYEEGVTEDGADGWSGWVCPRCRTPQDLLAKEPCCKRYSASWREVEPVAQWLMERGDLFVEWWRDGEWFIANQDIYQRKLGYSDTWVASSDKVEAGQYPNLPQALCRAALIAWLKV